MEGEAEESGGEELEQEADGGEEGGEEDGEGDAQLGQAGDGFFGEFPAEGKNNRGDDGGDAEEEGVELGDALEVEVAPTEGDDDEEGGGDEADACDEGTELACVEVAAVDAHLGGGGAGEHFADGDAFGEFFVGEPTAAGDEFVVHHGDVGLGAAEAEEAEFEEDAAELGEAGGEGEVGLEFGWMHGEGWRDSGWVGDPGFYRFNVMRSLSR